MVIITKTDSRPLVQWLHQGNPYLLSKIVRDGPIGAVAVSAAQAARLEATIAAASELGFGVIVDSEPHRVQLAEDHPLRCGGYRAAGLEWTRVSFDPDTMELGEEGRSELTALHRDAQAGHGATVFLWAGHRVRDEAPLSPGRRRELQLAADFLALARASGASHPAPQSGAPRHIAVGLAVDAREVGSRVSSELADAYSELSPDLFWLNCWNFSGGAAQYEAIRFLARRLQRLSGGIPCLVAGIGPLWEAALRNQIAAVCQGWGRGHLKFPPPPMPPAEARNTPFGVPAFHPAIRGAVPVGPKYEEASRELYRRHPCPCNHHAPTSPPESQRERHLHNLYWAEVLAESAVAGEPARTTIAIKAAVQAANDIRQDLGLGLLPPAWDRAGRDPSDGERIAVAADLWLPQVTMPVPR